MSRKKSLHRREIAQIDSEQNQEADSRISRVFNLSDLQRIRWVDAVVMLALSVGMVWSGSLWLSARSYPLTPLFPFLPTVPFLIDSILVYCVIGMMVLRIVIPDNKPLLISIFAILIALLLLDQSRWQIWVYQYILMISAITFTKNIKSSNTSVTINSLRLIIVCIYVWGGIQKINTNFSEVVFPWMCAPLTNHLGFISSSMLQTLGYLFPWLEIAMGIGLLYDRLRPYAIGSIVAMHLAILFCIGPLGYNVDSIILPWNIAMITFVMLLFINVHSLKMRAVLSWKGSLYRTILFILIAIAPILSFGNCIDSYLSFSMYSGNTDEGTFYIEQSAVNHLPEDIRRFTKPAKKNYYFLDIQKWADTEFHAAILPERRFYLSMQKYLCSLVGSYGDVTMIIKYKKSFLVEKNTEFIHCNDAANF